ncbi:class I SAM-dependent methyltransferase [Streptomyces prasinopilosus]|uniref:class I SAM-dependent methyltransferase n=1 Tax=Streptomyces prasinopilosus TaxID=67344 RepID=UPI000AA86B85|nr:methyltransferase domain-containing protein [Streptomyces prasinopilosus]
MAEATERTGADRALKAGHRAMWARGDYPSVAAEIIPGLGRELVDAAGVGPGDRVPDVAAGTGNAAIPAALAGADVVAADLAPELLETGRRPAEQRGARLRRQEADAEALPFATAPSTPCSPASGSWSPRTTRRPPANCSASAGRETPSVC